MFGGVVGGRVGGGGTRAIVVVCFVNLLYRVSCCVV